MIRDAGASPSTEALIARLTADARPVRRSWPPRRRFVLWLALEVAVLLVALGLLGFRPDVRAHLDGWLGVEVGLLLAAGTAAAALALRAAVPGREPSPGLAAAAVLGLLALAVVDALGPALGPHATVAAGWACGVRTLLVAALPWLLLLVVVRRGATLVPARAGLLAAIAAFFVAAAALRLVCPLDAREHVLVWHLGPVFLGLSAGALIGRAWLARWRERR